MSSGLPVVPAVPAVPAERAARALEMAGALQTVGAVLGVPVTTTDRDEWELDDRGLRVGLDWYLQRGHGAKEAAALAALQLWEGPLDTVRAPARDRRRRAIMRMRPAFRPLLMAVNRAQSLSELLRTMPGLRLPLRAAVRRSLPTDLSTLPRHLQWAILVLAQLTSEEAMTEITDATVAEEWQRLRALGGTEIDALRRVLVPDPEVPPLRRFERALALLLPSYQRLLELDLAEHGRTLLGGTDRAELILHSQEQLGSDDFAFDGFAFDGFASDDDAMSGDDSGDDPSEYSSDDSSHDSSDEDQPDAEADERAGAAPDAADLFASEHETFVKTVLSTPIPDASAAFDAAVQFAETRESDSAEIGDAFAAASGESAAATILAEYRSKSEELSGAIDSMRAIWARVIAERVAPRRSRSRAPAPEGDELATEALATIVAEALAGQRSPNAFLRRAVKPRLTRSVGSTDYVLMIDRSASMSGPAAESAANAALIMVEALAAAERDITHAERLAGIDLELDIRSSLIVFGAEALVIKPLTRGINDRVRRQLHGEVRSPSGATNDAAALRAAGDQLGVSGPGSGAFRSGPGSGTADPRAADRSAADRSAADPRAADPRAADPRAADPRAAGDGVSRRRIAVLVSDGGSNDQAAAARELHRLRAAGVTVYGIGLNAQELATRYAPHGVSIVDPRELPRALERIIEYELG